MLSVTANIVEVCPESAHDIRYLLFYLFFIILLSISLYLGYRLSLTPFIFITTLYIRHPTYHLLSVVPSHPTEGKSYVYPYFTLLLTLSL
jgi:hypothetical protein